MGLPKVFIVDIFYLAANQTFYIVDIVAASPLKPPAADGCFVPQLHDRHEFVTARG